MGDKTQFPVAPCRASVCHHAAPMPTSISVRLPPCSADEYIPSQIAVPDRCTETAHHAAPTVSIGVRLPPCSADESSQPKLRTRHKHTETARVSQQTGTTMVRHVATQSQVGPLYVCHWRAQQIVRAVLRTVRAPQSICARFGVHTST